MKKWLSDFLFFGDLRKKIEEFKTIQIASEGNIFLTAEKEKEIDFWVQNVFNFSSYILFLGALSFWVGMIFFLWGILW